MGVYGDTSVENAHHRCFPCQKNISTWNLPPYPLSTSLPKREQALGPVLHLPLAGIYPKRTPFTPLQGSTSTDPRGRRKVHISRISADTHLVFFFRSPFQRFLSRYRSSPGGVIALPVEISPFHPKSYGPFSHTGITRVLPY
jgi:hypothetical protein